MELEQEQGLGQDKVPDTLTVSTPIHLGTPRQTQTHRHIDTNRLHPTHPTEPWQIFPLGSLDRLDPDLQI